MSVLGEEADSLSVQQQRLSGLHGQFVFLHWDMRKMLTRKQALQNKSRLTFGIILPTHCKMRLRGETWSSMCIRAWDDLIRRWVAMETKWEGNYLCTDPKVRPIPDSMLACTSKCFAKPWHHVTQCYRSGLGIWASIIWMSQSNKQQQQCLLKDCSSISPHALWLYTCCRETDGSC